MTSLVTIECDRYRCRLTETACAARWRRVNEGAERLVGSLALSMEKCVGCLDGKARAAGRAAQTHQQTVEGPVDLTGDVTDAEVVAMLSPLPASFAAADLAARVGCPQRGATRWLVEQAAVGRVVAHGAGAGRRYSLASADVLAAARAARAESLGRLGSDLSHVTNSDVRRAFNVGAEVAGDMLRRWVGDGLLARRAVGARAFYAATAKVKAKAPAAPPPAAVAAELSPPSMVEAPPAEAKSAAAQVEPAPLHLVAGVELDARRTVAKLWRELATEVERGDIQAERRIRDALILAEIELAEVRRALVVSARVVVERLAEVA